MKGRKSAAQFCLSLALFGLMLTAAFDSTAQVSVGRRVENTAKPAKAATIDSKKLLRDIEFLSSDAMRGRAANEPAIEKARDFIERRFKESGLKPFGSNFRQGFTITHRGRPETEPGVNFIGYIKGKKTPEKYIVVTAHYDHVGVQNGEIYNGADDNASGTAALFAVAEALKKDRPNHSVIFVAFDAEEQGHQGSRHFVANLPVAKESILLNVNMDMLSRSDKGELYAAGTFHYPQFKPVLERAAAKAKVKLLLGHDDPKLGRDDWTGQSDHAAFHRAGIPFIYFGVEDHKDYHRPTDDFANIRPEFYVKAVETILQTLRGVDGDR